MSLPTVLLAIPLLSPAALADTYLVQGSATGGTFSFTVDPSQCSYAKPYCWISDVPLTENGVEQTTPFVFTGAGAGYPDSPVYPLEIVTTTNWYLGGELEPATQPGPSLYQVDPLTLIPGIYDMTGSVLGAGTLTVSQTPEPGTLGLLSTGILGGFAGMRRRLTRSRVSDAPDSGEGS